MSGGGQLRAADIRSLLTYDPDTGEFVWRTRPREMFKTDRAWRAWNAHYAENKAGHRSFSKDGADRYIQIGIFCSLYQGHRVAWAWMTGEWPSYQIDHINLCKPDNRWKNLRPATNAQNHANTGIRSTNRSGRKGVCWHKGASKWVAQITVGGARIHLGLFDQVEQAASAYERAAAKYFSEFARAA
jgi:hypothetical protein